MFIIPVQKRSKTKTVDPAKPKAEYRARPLNANDVQKMSSDELRWHSINNAQALDAALKADSKAQKETEQSDKKDGREVRPLKYSEVTEKFSAEDAAWHFRFNKQNYEAAFAEEERRRSSKKHVAKSRVELFYEGHGTEEEDQAVITAGSAFVSRTPAYSKNSENALVLVKYMKDNLMDATRIDSYTKAFRELVEQGKIKPLSYESADQFLAKHEELLPKAVPPLIAIQQAKVKATEEHFAKTQAASAKAGSTTVTDYPQELRGVPPLNDIEKASLRQKVRSMSADELAEKCATDPSFKKALDSLQ